MNCFSAIFLVPLACSLSAVPLATADKPNKIPDNLQTILEKAETFELLSLDPTPAPEKPPGEFHTWRVLGKTAVKDADTSKKLVSAFKKGVADNKGIAAKCFNPRHGTRVTYDGKTADFVICFECLQVKAFIGDKHEADFFITESPQKTFDDVLKEAKVPLAEKAKK